uniref:CCR4-NOT transcription complex subunit 3 isoform X2 n=1 Tax=Rhizophora mucronata TaxID=61149 RepID=A0A2P2IZ39_RHIMU
MQLLQILLHLLQHWLLWQRRKKLLASLVVDHPHLLLMLPSQGALVEAASLVSPHLVCLLFLAWFPPVEPSVQCPWPLT